MPKKKAATPVKEPVILTIMELQTRSKKKLDERKKTLEDFITSGEVYIHHGDKYIIKSTEIVQSGLFMKQLYFTGELIDRYCKI